MRLSPLVRAVLVSAVAIFSVGAASGQSDITTWQNSLQHTGTNPQ